MCYLRSISLRGWLDLESNLSSTDLIRVQLNQGLESPSNLNRGQLIRVGNFVGVTRPSVKRSDLRNDFLELHAW